MRRLPEPSETVILRQIRQLLQWNGFYVVRIQQGLGCHKGISDLIALRSGKVYFVEIKKPNGKLSEHQEKFKAEVEGRAGNYVVLKSVEDAERFIKAADVPCDVHGVPGCQSKGCKIWRK